MNGSTQSAKALIAAIVNGLHDQEHILKASQLIVCPPFLHISSIRHALYGYPKIEYGAQDCAPSDNGAFTGDISARMCKDSGCSFVILGHSERRQYRGEQSPLIAQKVAQALANDLKPIICVGETLEQRSAGKAQAIVKEQLQGSIPKTLTSFDEIIIAYEPVWAIGTGQNATPADIQSMHGFIRAELKNNVPAPEKVRILYGGSLKPENAAEILHLPGVQGGLIGGASLKAEDFLAIAKAAV